jgi:hypothetical protein
MNFVAGEDPETQRNGIVLLFWPGCKELRLPKSRYRSLVSRALNCMPTRFASFHFCFPATPFFQMARMLISTTLKRVKGFPRIKVHTGKYSRKRQRYSISSFRLFGQGFLLLDYIYRRKVCFITTIAKMLFDSMQPC